MIPSGDNADPFQNTVLSGLPIQELNAKVPFPVNREGLMAA